MLAISPPALNILSPNMIDNGPLFVLFVSSVSVILETPVIVLPCEVSRPLVLVAHLGRVAVSSVTQSPHTYRVELKNTSLYTLNTEQSPGLDCERHGKAILHNTHVELTLQRGSSHLANEESHSLEEDFFAGQLELDGHHISEENTWHLDGYIVGPLKVFIYLFLSPHLLFLRVEILFI